MKKIFIFVVLILLLAIVISIIFFIPEKEIGITKKIFWEPKTKIEQCNQDEAEMLWDEIFKVSYSKDNARFFFDNSLFENECYFYTYQIINNEIYLLSYKSYLEHAKGTTVTDDDGTEWDLNSLEGIQAYWANLTDEGILVFSSIQNFSSVPEFSGGIWGVDGNKFQKWEINKEDSRNKVSEFFKIGAGTFKERDIMETAILFESIEEKEFPSYGLNKLVVNKNTAWVEFLYSSSEGNPL